jgi:hypothetical protein
MKKSSQLVFVAFALLIISLGCAVISTPVPPTPMPPTDTPVPTATPTKPPTSTPVPPTPTLAPPSMLSELLDDVVIKSADNFDNIDKWITWNSQTAKVSNGVVEINGQPDWNGGFVQSNKFNEGMGVVIEFKKISGTEYSFLVDTGEWDTDSYRSFGVINYDGNRPRALVTQGKNYIGGNNLYGNLSLTKDNWFSFAIAIGKNGEFFAVVWDLNDPSHRAIYHETLNEKWIGKTWKFLIQTNTGTTLNVDNFSVFSFSGVK